MTFSAKFIVVVAYIIVRDGSVLVLRRSPLKDHAPGEWETGSGRVEYGEAPEDAVRREVREETGLQVEIVAPVDTFHFYGGVDREETVGLTFWCRHVGGEAVLSDEHDRAQWVAFDRAVVLLRNNGAARAVEIIARNVGALGPT